MTIVYVDVVLLLNTVVDYLLLLAAARITGAVFSRLRLAAAAVLGGLYAAAVFLPGCTWLSHPLCKLCAAVLMVLVGFGRSKRILRLLLVFLGASAALAGLILGLQLLGTGGLTLENGVLYTGFDVRLLLVTTIVCYCLLRVMFGGTAQHGGKRKDLCRVRIEIGTAALDLTALIDTGNTLRDPANNRPVMVVDAQAMEGLFPDKPDPRDPVGFLDRLQDRELRQRCRLLPYRAVGVDCGMLLAVRTDRVTCGGKELHGVLAALSPTPVSDAGVYQALIGAWD